ncbi:MAG: helix-turn-helix domain-containing protein [Patescibacteria group bacterium]
MGHIFSQKKEDNYLTLKEAAELSGYSSDYVGQLIRNGKISGKMVYANPVWMTTRSDLMDYLEKGRNNVRNKKDTQNRIGNLFRLWKTKFRSEVEVMKLYKGVLYFVIFISFIISLFTFYIFSVNFDAWLSERASEKREGAISVPEEYIEARGSFTF